MPVRRLMTGKSACSPHMRLEHEHTPTAIRERLAAGPRNSYLRDWVYGGIDGSVTTFAVVTGVVGASLSPTVVLILGVANLLGDGFSMAASNYSAEGTDLQTLELPGDQDQLIEAVARANPNTIVVLNTSGPAYMPWLSDVAGSTTWQSWAKATMDRWSSGLSFWMAAWAASWTRARRDLPVPSSSYMEPDTSSTRARSS